jgi:hypothetical protein
VAAPKLPRGPKQSILVRLGSGRSAAEPEANEEIESLGERLDGGAVEEEMDLSTLDGDGLTIEAQREALRERRAARWDERLSKREKRARRREERRAQTVYRRLLVYAAVVATAVIVVGLCEKEVDFVRDGIVCLCAVCGLSLLRLRSFGKGLKGL